MQNIYNTAQLKQKSRVTKNILRFRNIGHVTITELLLPTIYLYVGIYLLRYQQQQQQQQ